MKERLVVSRHQPVATNALGEVYYQPLSERAQGALMDLGELGQKQDPWSGSRRHEKEEGMKEQDKFHFEKELRFRQGLIRGWTQLQ